MFEYFDHVGFDIPALDNSKQIPAAWLGHYRIGQGTYDTDRALLDLTTWPPISRRIFELQQEKLSLALYLDENAGLYQRLNRSVADAIAPYLARVIQSGIDEGVFHVPDAFATAGLFLQISNSIHGALSVAINARGTNGAQKAAGYLTAAIEIQGLAIDRILGLPDGSISFGWPGYVKEVMNSTVLV